jgi:hypothetical protein
MLLRHSFIVIYVTAFILIIVFQAHNWYHSSLRSSQHIHGSGFNYISTYARSPCYNSPCQPPLLLTWHPPVVTGIVHLGPRLSVNYSPLSPIAPLCPPLQNPNPFSDFPEPKLHLIKARLNPLPSIQNNIIHVDTASGSRGPHDVSRALGRHQQ